MELSKDEEKIREYISQFDINPKSPFVYKSVVILIKLLDECRGEKKC